MPLSVTPPSVSPLLARLRVPATMLAIALVVGCVPGQTKEVAPPPPIGAGGTSVIGGIGGGGGRGGSGGFPVGGIGGNVSSPPPAGSFLTRPAVTATGAPPALSGGSLLVLADGKTAFAADPDRDRLYFADLTLERLLATVDLQPGDEPGRAVEDAEGGVHVVLRRGGALVSLAPDRTLRERRAVCAAPRGIAVDRASGLLHITCAGGELVSLLASGGAPTRTVVLDRDLRDVVLVGDQLFISRFRSGELLVVAAASGEIVERRPLPGSASSQQLIMTTAGTARAAIPGVAWRMRALLDGSTAVLHQESANGELGVQSGGYGGGPCKTAIAAAVTKFGAARASAKTGGQLTMATLPIDFAESRDGKMRATLLAGNTTAGLGLAQVHLSQGSMGAGGTGGTTGTGGVGGSGLGGRGGSGLPPSDQECTFPQPQPPPTEEPIEFRQPVGDAIAVDFDGRGRVLVQTREPARLEIISHRGGSIKLADESRFDSGHAVFHMGTRNGLACASCHPEGGDDGRTWRFERIGARRTQNLHGGIAATAPFHWDGDMRDLGHLMSEVFSTRMGGFTVADDHVQALAGWLDQLPAPAQAPTRDAAALERGRALFNDPVVACSTCHGGPRFSNNQTVAVGTGKPFQVPSLLGIGARAPYMHDGCAPTLKDRFRVAASCSGGDMHGKTSQLTAAQIDDLVAFLESL